jgi:integrase
MRSVQEANQVPWNHGRIIGPKPPLKPKHIWAIRTRLQHEDRVRDLAMFNLAIDSKLRGCDLIRLRVSHIHLGDSIRLRTTIVQQKTGRPVPFELTEPTREAAGPARERLAVPKPEPSRRSPHHAPLRSAIGRWVALIGLDPAAYGTHSLRRTKVALLYKRTGNLRACQLLLGHTKLESTVRYLGIEVGDALVLSEQTEL